MYHEQRHAMSTARFIILEGGEGAGKSTLAKALTEHLRESGVSVRCTREPGGSPGAEEVRGLIISGSADRFVSDTHLLLHYAARLDHLTATIVPALARGETVICDRFEISSYAYQVYAMDASASLFTALHQHVVTRLRDVINSATYVHCDIDATTGLRRVQLQQQLTWSEADQEAYANRPQDDTYDSLPIEFHEKIRGGMTEAKQHLDPMFSHVHIDAGKTQEEMLRDTLQHIQ